MGGAAELDKLTLSGGGAPTSLWTAIRYFPGNDFDPLWSNNLYLIKIPIAAGLPDGFSRVAPGSAWSGDRLWLVGEHDLVLKYRVRDDGLWSGWFALPTNVAIAGGAAVISDGTTVELFARGASDRKVYTTSLTSATTCTPGACTWKPWTLLPAGSPVTTAFDPAAASRPGGGPMVVAQSTVNNGVYFTKRTGGTWSAWRRIRTFTTNQAPSVTWHPPTARFWVAARDSAKSQIMMVRVDPAVSDGNPTSWTEVGVGGSQAPWAVAPTIVWDGQLVRTFTSATPFPNTVYQTVWNGSAWLSWKPLVSQSISGTRAAAAVVNGDVDLMTNWMGNHAETFVK
jgi:hypothetical protein